MVAVGFNPRSLMVAVGFNPRSLMVAVGFTRGSLSPSPAERSEEIQGEGAGG